MHVARTGRGVILAAALFCTAAVKQTSIHQAKHSITKKIGRTLQMSSKPNLTYEACVGPIEHSVTEDVSKYYGETLKSSDDLKTNACCTGETVPPRIRKLLSNIHDEVMMKYYGCGLVIPEDLRGKTIVDLGCGAGRDVYTLAQLVGQTGKVIGVDMTEAQLEVARRTTSWHMEKFGFSTPNVEFIQTEIEHLEAIADNSVDIIVSNCVVNLSNNKKAVL
jgi:SAM-dependent methyltransferase